MIQLKIIAIYIFFIIASSALIIFGEISANSKENLETAQIIDAGSVQVGQIGYGNLLQGFSSGEFEYGVNSNGFSDEDILFKKCYYMQIDSIVSCTCSLGLSRSISTKFNFEINVPFTSNFTAGNDLIGMSVVNTDRTGNSFLSGETHAIPGTSLASVFVNGNFTGVQVIKFNFKYKIK